ncbi:DNA repair and recombination protein RAD54B-like [Cimex lectularius]|uniref:DNA repair and recombination protein RAD54-like n=1 Tax=Cimex lectularius TaxID=79782 RepID=A0A8I6RJ57_CIMLE|nr:DNA repair and recombination protein RAD54B-like [Cimex lectularius]
MRKSNAPSKRGGFVSPIITSSNISSINQLGNNALKERQTSILDKKSNPGVIHKQDQKPNLDSTKCSVKTRYFTVVYGKPTKKKHKTWEGDGTLKVEEKSAILKDDSGVVIGQSSKLSNPVFTDGSQLFIGGKEIEIVCEILTDGQNIPSNKRTLDENVEEEAKEEFSSKKKKLLDSPLSRSFSLPKDIVPLSNGFTPLVMPRPDDQHQWHYNPGHLAVTDVSVDPFLCRVLRPHQREGVEFLYRCVMGIRSPGWTGAILADEMGLGKTIQCITLIWTLLKQGPYGKVPVVQKVLIVVPSSLIENWNNEFIRWLGSHRIKLFLVNKKRKPKDFKSYHQIPVMIISYEMFLRCFDEIKDIKFDLMICDEGHRLKNSNIRTNNVLNEMNCKRRILLTGTPVQNDLQEFFSLVDFVNPGILGTLLEFKTNFESCIMASREPNAPKELVDDGEKKADELNRATNSFILRRTQSIIGKFLPKKHEYVVFCEPSNLQKCMYTMATDYWNERETGAEQISHLAVISALKKICNHPTLIFKSNNENEEENVINCLLKTLDGYTFRIEDSAKLKVTAQLLENLKGSKEKIVIVSNFTQTLDLLEKVCNVKEYKFLKFDGSTVSSKRNDIVNTFNSVNSDVYVLLLSSKAGGVGLNLIGGSRLILYDSDWNPATDLQAMARIWRDGQKKTVHIYRLLTSGTLEEKIFQRQLTKAGLSEAVVDSTSNSASIKLSKEEIKDLFTFTGKDKCLTHSMLNCDCSGDGVIPEDGLKEEIENDDSQLLSNKSSQSSLRMNQLLQWEHHDVPIDPEIIDGMKLNKSEFYINFIFRNTTQCN